ncbi:MAG: hypothetical protein Q7J57_16620 [Gemmobacter sp.]|nr:hypothetical protein [Gemmobacter sp.]
MTKKIVVIGNSHVESLLRALQKRPDPDLEVFNFRREAADMATSPAARAAMAERIGPVDVLCFLIQGNLHNVLGLINDPQPFWLAPAEPNGQLVSHSMMRAHMQARMKRNLEFAQAMAQAIPCRQRILIEPPPPAGDADHIRKHPGAFAEKIALGVSPDALRIQLYRLQSDVYREHATALDARFLPCPSAARDERGFLAAQYWNADPTHGNAGYGALVLRDLRAAIGETA